MKVGIITQTQADELRNELIQPDWYFNPVLDCDGNWIITEQEIYASIYPQNDWIKSLQLIDWCKPISTIE